MNISIFAKNPSKAKPDGHLQRVSSIIRGQQIATQIGAKLNPEKDFENDVCIYVKPHVKPSEDFNFKGVPYLDIIDGWMLLPLLQKHPEVTAITCSYADFEYVIANINNKVILIPQHHCNFERIKKTKRKITTVGCIGASAAFTFLPQGLKEHLENRGIKLLEFSSFQSREDIVNFYLDIDVQIVWRPYTYTRKIRLANPLKLVNAASFGVPTIALDEPAFSEMKDYYFPVSNLDEFLKKLNELINSSDLHNEYSEKCIKKAELYHIENIGKLYKDLIR